MNPQIPTLAVGVHLPDPDVFSFDISIKTGNFRAAPFVAQSASHFGKGHSRLYAQNTCCRRVCFTGRRLVGNTTTKDDDTDGY